MQYRFGLTILPVACEDLARVHARAARRKARVEQGRSFCRLEYLAVACEQALLFGQAKLTSRERAPRGFAARSRVLARLVSLAQIGELARRLALPSL